MKDLEYSDRAYLHAFMKTAQYLASLTTHQDVWQHIAEVMVTFFGAESAGFARVQADGGIEFHHLLAPDEQSRSVLSSRAIRDSVREVLETGFLASCPLAVGGVSHVFVLLPISLNNKTGSVMLVGHATAGPISNELLNVYLAISGLAGTTINRLISETELKEHRSHLQQLVAERTGELTRTLDRLECEIAGHMRTEEALRETHDHLNTIIEFLPDATFMMDDSGKVIAWNRAMEEMTGISKVDMLQLADYEYAIPFYGKRMPTLVDLVLKPEAELETSEYNYIQRNGDLLYGEAFVPQAFDGKGAYLSSAASVLRDGAGKVVGTIQSLRDITERKRAEETLQFKNVLLSTQQQVSIDGILVVDENNRIISTNRQFVEMHGLPGKLVEDGADEPILQFIATQMADPQAFLQQIQYLCEHRRETSREEMPMADGRVFDCYSAPMFGPDDRYYGRVWYCRDITERKRAEAERLRLEAENRLLQKAESLGRMAGAIAHHFNNQFGVVMGNLELALMDLAGDTGIRKNLNAAMQAARRSAEISGQMLTYLGQSTAKHQTLDLSDVCRQALSRLKDAMPEGIALKTDLLPSGPVVRAHVNDMQQVLTHLINNGWESIGHNAGTVTLRTRIIPAEEVSESHLLPIAWKPAAEVFACLEVKDTGSGILEDDLEKIFDPFFTTKFTGRGLGLPVVLGNVKTWGGAIGVESKKNNGSLFRVFLPLAGNEISMPSEKPSGAHRMGAGGNVLLVEDQETVRNMAEAMLEQMGFEVLAASSGAEAVELFQANPDKILCVMTDLRMPGMNGWETLAVLRKIRPHIPAILVSGCDEACAMTCNYSERPHVFLQKPYSMGDLQAAIDTALKKPANAR